MKVGYRLDPSETWGPGKTKISIRPLGPWIDNPDGVVNQKRKHVGIPGFGIQTKEIEPGDGEVEFSWTFPGARRTSCFFLLQFIAPDGDPWPWDWRGGAVNFKPYSKFFYVEPDAEFGMFAFPRTPSFTIHWGDKVKKGTTSATATVRDVFGEVVAEKTFDVAPADRGTTKFDLPGFGLIHPRGLGELVARANRQHLGRGELLLAAVGGGFGLRHFGGGGLFFFGNAELFFFGHFASPLE